MINKLIEQIGGRERLEFLSEYRPNVVKGQVTFREVKLMASALLAVLDAQNKTALVLRPFGYDGETFRKSDIDHHSAVVYYPAPPAASVHNTMQPLYIAGDGRIRFKENAIVRHLLTSAGKVGVDLNSIAMDDFSDDDRMQLAQLIGYSLGGYGELSYVSDESYNAAVAAAPAQGGDGGLHPRNNPRPRNADRHCPLPGRNVSHPRGGFFYA